jgi:poly-gamma-glutamate capsule biosynthesis protein CapA/YwtB (metallophosphatase superfamily)
MSVTLALAGDTMLGRGVGERLAADPGHALLADDVEEIARSADLFVLNLECCISERGERVPEPGKPFFFRAPPVAAERLAALGVSCVTLANNHALDYGPIALRDTLARLREVGVAAVGAGLDVAAARTPVVLSAGGMRVRVVAVTDHPSSYAAGIDRPGVAYAGLARELPGWLARAASPDAGAELVLMSPHWGPNMRGSPVPHVRRAAAALEDAGATAIAGHSAHVPQGVRGRTLFDLGDFVDDYAVDRELRNDLGLLWLLTLGPDGPERIEGVPLRLRLGHTELASDVEATLLLALLEERCAAVGASVHRERGRFVFEPTSVA